MKTPSNPVSRLQEARVARVAKPPAAVLVWWCGMFALLLSATPLLAQSEFNRVRYFPAPGREAAMVGGRFTGSNDSSTNGFVELARITAAPAAGAWTELTFTNPNVYRYIKYEGPAQSGGAVAELEFYSATTRLTGTAFGTATDQSTNVFGLALDGNTATFFESDIADDTYVGIDLGTAVQVAQPSFSPGAGVYATAQQVTISCSTSGATIRYTIDGTTPTRTNGTVIASGGKITVSTKTTVAVFAHKTGLADSQLRYGTYIIGAPTGPGQKTWHGGNSLTDTIDGWLDPVATSAGYDHTFLRFTIPGAPTDYNWATPTGGFGGNYNTTFDNNSVANAPIDHLSTQPFAGHGRGFANEAYYSNRFFQRARYVYAADSTFTRDANGLRTIAVTRDGSSLPTPRSPDVQPWLYVQWPSTQMVDSWARGSGALAGLGLWPGGTYEESVANHVFYAEQVRPLIDQQNTTGVATYTTGGNTESAEVLPGTKPVRIVPVGTALARLKYAMETGGLPGLGGSDFFPLTYSDGLHMNPAGRYLASLVFHSCFYRVSPEGHVMSAGSGLTPAQATVFQQVAWDVVQNYAWAGIYTAGPTPTGAPQVSPGPGALADSTRVTFTSSTAGAWFRYTLDGTAPTPSTGQLYLSPLTVRPGATLKVIAFKHGHAPSAVATFTYGSAPSSRLLMEEALTRPAGAVQNATDVNPGWGQRWRSSATLAEITGGASLSYGALRTGGAALLVQGGSAGRQLNLVAATGPFVSYLRDDIIRPQGRELWCSALLRKDAATDDAVGIHLTTNVADLAHQTSGANVSLGYFGTTSNSGGKRYWSLRHLNDAGTTVTVRTNTEIVIGQPVLLVVKMQDGSPNTAALYVNPTTLGGNAPATPSASGTTTRAFGFKSVAFGGAGTAGGVFDEFRLGENFAAVTPSNTSELDVSRGAAIPSGGTDVIAGTTEGAAQSLTYTLANSGLAPLTFPSASTIGSPVNCAAQITTQPPASIAPSATGTLGVTVTPTIAGAWSFQIQSPNNDPDESLYVWTVSGSAQSRFAAWTASIPWNGADSTPTGDPDRDGRNNRLEFFHGTDPLLATGPAMIANGPVQVPGSEFLRVKFRRQKALGSLVWQIKTSTSLTPPSWTPQTGLPETLLPAESDAVADMVQIDIPTGGEPALFVRLEVGL